MNKNHFQDCEGGDRLEYGLPFGQDELIEALLEVNKNLVLVLLSGNAVEMLLQSHEGFIHLLPALTDS